MKIGSHKQTLFAQGSALGWELFGPRGADAQGVALGLSQSSSHLLDDAPASQGGCYENRRVRAGCCRYCFDLNAEAQRLRGAEGLR